MLKIKAFRQEEWKGIVEWRMPCRLGATNARNNLLLVHFNIIDVRLKVELACASTAETPPSF